MKEKEFIDYLVETGIIPRENYSSFRQVSGILRWNDPRVEEAFRKFGFETVREVQSENSRPLAPVSFIKKERIAPLIDEGNYVIAYTDNPFNYEGIKKAEWLLGKPIVLKVVPYDEFNKLITIEEEALTETEGSIERTGEDIFSAEEESPAVSIVNQIFATAIRARASDIHFEPFKDYMRVRIRIDGVLKTVRTIPQKLIPSVTSRLKIMANLDIAEKRLPQDGRMVVKAGGKEIDVRVSSLPTYFGERIVLRLLVKENILYSTKDLGLLEEDYKKFESLIRTPHGIILVTGPTGSGKTTTLYASISEINREEINIITVEDPVEYQLDGISQVQVKPDIGLNFAGALRSILRQDPDVIMIGEIRDVETAEIAIQSALTGHLVFSTLHTNDAASSVTRLIEMGIEPFLVASSVIGVVAQRLVRKICPHCKYSYKPDKEELKDLGIKSFDGVFFRGRGCDYCMGTGYLGRTAIYEILVVDKLIRKLVLDGRDSDEIKEAAVNRGMKTLRMDGAEKVKLGITTTEEVLRVTRG